MNEELKAILIKVQELYRKYGIKSITMDDVARSLAISKKTLYQYVCDKTELVARVIELEKEIGYSELKAVWNNKLNAIESILMVYQHVHSDMKRYNPSMGYDLQKYYPELHKKYWNYKKKKMYQAIKINIRQGKREGLFRAEINGEVIAKLHVARFEGIFVSDFLTHEDALSLPFIRETFIYHIHGLASETGLEVFNQNINKLDIFLHNNLQNNTKIS